MATTITCNLCGAVIVHPDAKAAIRLSDEHELIAHPELFIDGSERLANLKGRTDS